MNSARFPSQKFSEMGVGATFFQCAARINHPPNFIIHCRSVTVFPPIPRPLSKSLSGSNNIKNAPIQSKENKSFVSLILSIHYVTDFHIISF